MGLHPVNYSTNATVQSQREMNGVVDTFSGLMGTVVGQFRNVSAGHATQLRAALAEPRAAWETWNVSASKQ